MVLVKEPERGQEEIEAMRKAGVVRKGQGGWTGHVRRSDID